MATDESANWICNLKAGDSQALELLWKQYFAKLSSLIRKRLGSLQLRAADEEDIALSALNSLCAGLGEDKFPRLGDREDLWKILLTIAFRKTNDYRDYFFAQKRGGGDQRGDSVFAGADQSGLPVGMAQFAARDPSPELLATLTDTITTLFAQLDEPLLLAVARHKIDGYTNEEIATKLECTTRTVERKLERIRQVWTDSADGSNLFAF